VLEKLAGRLQALVSVDTRKAEVARAALGAGAGMVNDSGAATAGEEMASVMAGSGAAYVVMHSRGTPETMQKNPVYGEVAAEVEEFFHSRMKGLLQAGLKEDQLVLDVGIGFGKTLEHNLLLLRATQRFAALGRPLLVGVSRKSFMRTLLGLDLMERLPAALACTAWSVRDGAGIVRTHDVPETRAAVRMTEAIMAAGWA
jgi:dihydropteroate synthase